MGFPNENGSSESLKVTKDWFGSKTAFEASVQSRVADVVQGKFRSFPLSYGAHLLTLIALPWGSIDIASAYIHAGDYVDGAYFALGLICWWLILVPSIATITISTLRRISQFAGHVWPFHLLLISQYPLISFVQQILWQFLEPRHARLAFSLLSLIPGAVAVYLRCWAFGWRARAWPEGLTHSQLKMLKARLWFQSFSIFIQIWGTDLIWLIFFQMDWETTN